MSHPHDDEINEIIEYITGMRRTFNRKLDDHLFIMEQQNHRIEEQYRIMDEQRAIIDELAWQIRDLRDSVRQVSEKKSNCVCNYENHVSRYRSNDAGSNQRNFRIQQIDEEEHEDEDEDEDEDIYEKIEVTKNQSSKAIPTDRNMTTAIIPKYTEIMKQKQNIANELSNNKIDRNTRYVRPANSVNFNGIMERHEITNSLHDALNRLKIENLSERDSIDEDGTEDILLRNKPFKQFARNSQRGSSKVVCSMVSDIEQDYLPNEEELDEENFVRISSRHVVSDAAIDYDEKATSSKRMGIAK